jgi:hypothetical protein
MEITKYDDLRFKVNKEFKYVSLSSQEAEKLKQVAMGGTVASGNCSNCEKKSDFKALGSQERCTDCHNKGN